MSDYDVIVIGSGAGGGTLVNRLAPSGKKILLLERGDFLTREPQNVVALRTSSLTAATSQRNTWLTTKKDKEFAPQVHVVDTGFSPSIGAVNPGLTAMANALRLADHLLERTGAEKSEQVSARGG